MSIAEAPEVKITNAIDASWIKSAVREKSDGQQAGHQGHQRQRNDAQENSEDQEIFEVADDRVVDAVDSFAHDAQALANGLNASMSGQGPGLRVVLKDGTGAIVRQFTGEEFLQLREAVAASGSARGKILDRKL